MRRSSPWRRPRRTCTSPASASTTLPASRAASPSSASSRCTASASTWRRPSGGGLTEVPFGLHHPLWIEDPDFDIDNHVRHTAVPRPGGTKELSNLVSRLVAQPLDRSRPLWEIWLIEGLEAGHVGLLSKVHHAAIDGASGNELLVALLDLAPEVAEHVPESELGARPDPHRGRAAGLRGQLARPPAGAGRQGADAHRGCRARRAPPRPGLQRAGAAARAVHGAPHLVQHRPDPPPELRLHLAGPARREGREGRGRLHRQRRGAGPVRRRAAVATSMPVARRSSRRWWPWSPSRCAATTSATPWATGSRRCSARWRPTSTTPSTASR